MMARFSGVGPEAFSRDRISNGLSTVMRDHVALNPSRVDMLLGLASQPQTPVYDISELDEEDVWGASEGKPVLEEPNPLSDVRKFESGSFVGFDVIDATGDSDKVSNNGRRWIGDTDSGLSLAFGEAGRSRGFPSSLNRAAVNGNGSFSSRDSSAGRTSSRVIPNRDSKLTTHFSQLTSAVESSRLLHQSAPVNVPDWSKILGSERPPTKMFPDDDDVSENEDEERLPPHELIAREYAKSQITPFSMCEGVGRTLKGRDLSRVRNAVLRRTGFLSDQ